MGRQDSSLAEFIGISAPESPKFLVANNFLSRYFYVDKASSESYKYENFENLLVCEESDEKIVKKIKYSFECFFDVFTGKDIMSLKKKNVMYFPVNKTMLRSGRINLRHLLFNLQYADKKFIQNDMVVMLEEYLYGKSLGANNLLGEICANVSNNGPRPEYKRDQTFESFQDKQYFQTLGTNLNEDLNTLFTSENFVKVDFYKKYDYLSTLLTSYVIQFILHRKDQKNQFILCKGAVNKNLNSGDFHRSCVLNYANIRDVFPELLIDFYQEKMKVENIILKLEKEKVYTHDGILFTDYINELFGIILQSQINEDIRLIKTFSLREGSESTFSKEEFLVKYVNFSKKIRGANIAKISSTLPTSGREIGFIFPSNSSKHKYFAMSGELAEFYIRLYLSSKNDLNYDYLDNFLEWLQERYNICMVKSNKLDRYLSDINAKVTIDDYRINEDALIENLYSINCLIKLSDSGYVITLPEKKGEFKLL